VPQHPLRRKQVGCSALPCWSQVLPPSGAGGTELRIAMMDGLMTVLKREGTSWQKPAARAGHAGRLVLSLLYCASV